MSAAGRLRASIDSLSHSRRRAVAAVMALVVVTAGVGAYVAFTDSETVVTAQTFDQDSFSYRMTAYETLQMQSVGTGTLERLEATLSTYRGANRTTDGPFETDSAIASAVADDGPRASSALADSDAVLAWAAIQDAARAKTALKERGVEYDTGRVTSLLDSARQSYSDGEKAELASAATAISHYGDAWRQAQRALDYMDAAMAPRVTVGSERDPIREGPINATVTVSVFDVRTHDIDELRVQAAGRTQTVAVNASTPPAREATVAVDVTLAGGVTNVTATARDPGGGRLANTTGGEATGEGRAVLDGDLLVGRFEAVTGTDPTDPDTDGDGTIDGMVDYDGDGLVAVSEQRLGTLPNATNTDGDALPDAVEANISALDPTKADTNGDGVADGAGDFDGDGLSVDEERDAGTRVAIADTDGDGIDDGTELSATGTNPTNSDTDGDGINDGREQRLGTDPTSVDSDGDGTPDNQTQHTLGAENTSLGASVAVTGTGGVVNDLSVHRAGNANIRTDYIEQYRASPIVSIEADGEFQQANLTIGYDPAAVANESALELYTVGKETAGYERVNATVNPDNDTISATVQHFSSYVALTPYTAGGGATDTADDGSFDPDGGQFAAFEEYEQLDEPFERGLESFVVHRELGDNGPRVVVYLQKAQGYAVNNREAFGTIEFTNVTVDQFVNGPYGMHPVDSQGDGNPAAGATERGSGGDEVYIMDDGREVDFSLGNGCCKDAFALQYNVTGPNPQMRVRFRKTTNAGETVVVGGSRPEGVPPGERIPLPALQDTDGDGIPDRVEESPTLTSTGETVVTNASNPDTDGDGLPDGEELTSFEEAAGRNFAPHFNMKSNPADNNTDDIGLDDGGEERRGSDPMEEEILTTWFSIPTKTSGAGSAQPVTRDGRYVLQPSTVYTPERPSMGGDPRWLTAAYREYNPDSDDPVPNGGSFVLLDVPVYTAAGNASQSNAGQAVRFSLSTGKVIAQGLRASNRPDSDSSLWVTDSEAVPLSGEQTTVSLVIAIAETPEVDTSGSLDDDIVEDINDGDTNVDGVSLRRHIGSFSMDVLLNDDSIFARDRDGGNGFVTVSTKRGYAVEYFGGSEAVRIASNSLDRVRSMAINALSVQMGPVGGAAEGGLTLGFVIKGSSLAGKALAAGSTTILAANIVRGNTSYTIASWADDVDPVSATSGVPDVDLEYVEGIRIQEFQTGEVSTLTVPISRGLRRTIHYTHTGAVLVRLN